MSSSSTIVDYSPSEVVRRQSAAWSGLSVETVQITEHKPYEYQFRASCHLLVAAELGERYDGETLLDGLPRSSLRNFTRKLTFVPSGYDLRGSLKPRALTRAILFYIDPRGPLADPDLRFAEMEFKPRLFFYDRDLWETALKLKSQVEKPSSMHRQYAESLGISLTHELIRINDEAVLHGSVSRGGLAGWQEKRVADYIEAHVADDIPLITLAQLARLSPYHFCRSFKQSFGVPAHRYHIGRRIERAKQLLGNRELSITAIALEIGFSDTSTFTTTFRRLTGVTPSCYRRSID
jgi:AraC family transcriptional regulator